MAQLTKVDGLKIRAKREDLGKSLVQVAGELTELLGRPTHPDSLSNIERGHRQPSIPLLKALRTVLNVELAEIAPDPPKRRRPLPAVEVGSGRA